MSKFTIMFMLSAVCCSADITYDVDQTVGIGSVKGFIETDGTTGVLGASNILNWNLLLNDGTNANKRLHTKPGGADHAPRLLASFPQV